MSGTEFAYGGTRDPADRPTAEQLTEHPFLQARVLTFRGAVCADSAERGARGRRVPTAGSTRRNQLRTAATAVQSVPGTSLISPYARCVPTESSSLIVLIRISTRRRPPLLSLQFDLPPAPTSSPVLDIDSSLRTPVLLLRLRYAMSGTDTAYAATRRGRGPG
eukprot:2146100-Rhodomonas_salina.1